MDEMTFFVNINEKNKNAIIDIDEVIRDHFTDVSGYCKDCSMRITAVNGQTDVSTMLGYFYKNGFRINSDLLVKSEPVDGSVISVNDMGGYVITSENDESNVGKLFMLSFDELNVLDECYISLAFDANYHIPAGNIELTTKYVKTNGDISITKKTRTVRTAYDVEYKMNAIVYVVNDADKSYDFYGKQSHMINSNMESFMLLRTNPKLTGNIKLVATPDDALFLDTFKVSSTSVTNQKQYRHQPVSTKGDYPRDVYKVFKTLPLGELYSVYNDSYDPHKNYFDLNLQIENIYEYGAEYNNDRLYAENFRILAPLYIGKHLPDYFAVFRTKRLISDAMRNDTDILKSMISDSACVQVFDLRDGSNIGSYLHGYQQMISKYFAGTCSLQFIEQEYDTTDPNYRQGRNTWKGISVSKGILTSMTETSFFATKTLNGSCPQEKYDMFLLDGYSRHGLVYPNILNLEYMFDDKESVDYGIYNYFGLYLTENEFIRFNKVIYEVDAPNPVMEYYDADDNKVVLPNTNIDVIEMDEYEDRIFFMSTMKDAARVKNTRDVENFSRAYVQNRPYKNYVNIEGQEVHIKDGDNAFITMRFTKPITVGEHFRFIIKDNGISKVLEVIASSDERLRTCDDCISPWILTNRPSYSVDETLDDGKTEIYRLNFYSLDGNGNAADLKTQLQRMMACIGKFGSYISVCSYNDNTLSIVSTQRNAMFQHVMADDVDMDYIHYYNDREFASCHDLSDITDLYRTTDLPYSMSGMELLGQRKCSITGFMNSDTYAGYHIYEIYKDISDEIQKSGTPLVSTVNGYYPLVRNVFGTYRLVFGDDVTSSDLLSVNEDTYVMYSIYDVNCSIVVSVYDIGSRDVNICSPTSCSVSLMGINSIKDINMYIGYNDSHLYETSTSASFSAGEMVSLLGDDVRIRKFVAYRIVSGGINGIPVSSNTIFMVLDNMIVYSDDSGNINTISDYGTHLQFTSDSVIEIANTKAFQ